MKINVFFSPLGVDELYFKDKTTVVIDVLRASSTIITAVNNGAKEVVPVSGIESAIKLSGGMFGGYTLLCGERNTKKIDGFALGNSPFEFAKEIVENKTIVLYTTNGTKAIVKAKFSENLFIGSFLNLSYLINHLINLNVDVEILCSGRNNLFSLEDALCAGLICEKIMQKVDNVVLSDSAKASIAIKKKYGSNIIEALKDSDHGKILIENGFEKDIEYCSQISVIDIIPHYNNGSIKKLNTI